MHPLDNVIWQALSTRQSHFGRDHGGMKRFLPEVSVLAGFPSSTEQDYELLASVLQPGERIGLFLEHSLRQMPQFKQVISAPLLEMVCDNGRTSQSSYSAAEIVPLAAENVDEMLALTALTLPGPFGPRTHEMGDYFGIRNNGTLIAMSGERLKVPGYTEISAVCTHPEHLGKGYARALMSLIMERIVARGETAFLHVRADNARAIGLYESLGFRNRITLQYVVLEKLAA